VHEDPSDDVRPSADDRNAPNDPTVPSDPIAPSVPSDPPAIPFPDRAADPATDPSPTEQVPEWHTPAVPPPLPPPPSGSSAYGAAAPASQTPVEPAPQEPEPGDPQDPAAIWASTQASPAAGPDQATWQPSTRPVSTGRARRRVWPVLVAVVLSAALIGGGLGYGLSRGGSNQAADGGITLVQGTQAAPVSNAAQMIQRVLPSIVNIRVTVVSQNPFGGSQSGQAEGSGVILSKNGLIATNAHVVSEATSVKVEFTTGRKPLDGTVLGIDTTHDLAVVKVNANDLSPITIGHSKTLKLADQVYAIGYPLDLGVSVTRGVISGLDRSIAVSRSDGSTEHLVGMLQTDAAINPGNSGGALIDDAGQLVGINTAGAQASEADNVGFAIAIDGAIPIIRDLSAGKSTGTTTTQTAWLGVSVEPVGDQTDAQFGVPAGTRGAGVADVVQGGPAASAGIQQGDVIVSLGGRTVNSLDGLTQALSIHKPGDRVPVELVSSSGTRTVTVTLGTRPASLG
jgi:putative serine protease PepD